jgi:integrase
MKPTPGIRRLHRDGCPAIKNRERRCRCDRGYEASVWDRTTRRKIRRLFPTEAAAKAWRSDAQHGIRRGTVRAGGPVTVNDAADELIEGMRSGSVRNRSGRPYKPSAIRSYESALDLYVRPDLGAMKLSDVQRRHVQRIIDDLVADGAEPSTVRNAVMPLRVIYRRAIRDDLVAVSRCTNLDLPANKRRREWIAAKDDPAALIAALPTPYDRALWAVALYGGLRRGELLALRWRDVDLTTELIRVESSYDPKAHVFIDVKYEASFRRVPIAGPLRLALLEHRVAFGAFDPDALVFGENGQPFDDEAVRNRARAIWEEAELVPVGLHEGRHTAASVMIAAGINAKAVSEFIGHSSISTTLDYYGHLLPGSINEATGLLDGFLGRNGAFTGARDEKSLQNKDSGRS